jgi:hypothetical protein
MDDSWMIARAIQRFALPELKHKGHKEHKKRKKRREKLLTAGGADIA